MPRVPDNGLRPQDNAASRGNARGGRFSTQGRGGRQGEYWNEPGASRVDIYAVVDSWRSYSKDADTLQSGIAGKTRPKTSFDPFAQVFQSQAANQQRMNQPQPSQPNPQYRQDNARYQNQAQQHTQHSYAPQIALAVATVRHRANGQDQGPPRAPSHSTAHEPMRLSNGVQERQQPCQPPSGSWTGNAQPTFTQQMPIRPTKGVDRSRGYATSRTQPVPSIENAQPVLEHSGTGYDGFRRTFPRQSTPRRDDLPAIPPPAPVASKAYLAQAHMPPEKLEGPQRLLVILDLNGTLMLKPDFRRPKEFHIRPGAPKLLEYLFANHIVMVYTSGQPHNAEIVARGVFSAVQYDKLAAIWARDKLDLTLAQYRTKVQVYKKLSKIWASNEIQSCFFPPGTGKWDQTNTILVDDSHLKALQEPHNLLQVTEFTSKHNGLKKKAYNKHEEQICLSLIAKLEALKWQKDVSRLIFQWQTGRAEIPKVPGSNFFVDEKVDQREQAQKDLEAAMNMPTPQSPLTTDNEASDDEGQGGTVLSRRNFDASFTPERQRSESPVDEDVFKELLSGGKGQRDILTPESQT